MTSTPEAIGRLLCALRIHRSNYSGCEYTFAPQSVRCERCGRAL